MDVQEIIKFQNQIDEAIFSHQYRDLRPDAVVIPEKAWLAIFEHIPLLDRYSSAKEKRPNFLQMGVPIVPSRDVESLVVEGGYQGGDDGRA